MLAFTLEQDVCLSCYFHFLLGCTLYQSAEGFSALEDKVRICLKFPVGDHRANPCPPRKRQDSHSPEEGTCVLERIREKSFQEKLLGILAYFPEGAWTERGSMENEKEAGLPG